MEKSINLPGPIGSRVLEEASALSSSLARDDCPAVFMPGALSFGDGGGLDGLPALKPLGPGDGRPAKWRACNALDNRFRSCDHRTHLRVQQWPCIELMLAD